jgi:hypothetical protein
MRQTEGTCFPECERRPPWHSDIGASREKKKTAPRRAPPVCAALVCYFWLIIGPACVMLPFTNSVSIFSFW